MTRPIATLLISALLLAACSSPGGPPPGADPVPGIDDAGFTVEPGAEDPIDAALATIPDTFAELTADGLVEGEFRPHPACLVREDDGGPYLHVAFDTTSDTGDGVPALSFVLRIRPYDHTGPIELTGDDVEIGFRPQGGLSEEPTEATVEATVTQSGDPTYMNALIEFDGRYEAPSGQGSFRGRVSCNHAGP